VKMMDIHCNSRTNSEQQIDILSLYTSNTCVSYLRLGLCGRCDGHSGVFSRLMHIFWRSTRKNMIDRQTFWVCR